MVSQSYTVVFKFSLLNLAKLSGRCSCKTMMSREAVTPSDIKFSINLPEKSPG